MSEEESAPTADDGLQCHILPDNPVREYVTGDADSFQFQPFVDTFASMCANKTNGTPFTIVVDGAWGSGKTTLMEMTRAALDAKRKNFTDENKETERPCKTFWFNAWKYSSSDSLLAALLMEMFREMEEDTGFWEAVKTKIDGKVFFSSIVNQTMGKFIGDPSKLFHELRVSNKTAFLDEFTGLVKMLIKSFCGEEKKDEEDLLDSEKNKDREGAFVIFIDDLDRCPPNRVLQVCWRR